MTLDNFIIKYTNKKESLTIGYTAVYILVLINIQNNNLIKRHGGDFFEINVGIFAKIPTLLAFTLVTFAAIVIGSALYRIVLQRLVGWLSSAIMDFKPDVEIATIMSLTDRIQSQHLKEKTMSFKLYLENISAEIRYKILFILCVTAIFVTYQSLSFLRLDASLLLLLVFILSSIDLFLAVFSVRGGKTSERVSEIEYYQYVDSKLRADGQIMTGISENDYPEDPPWKQFKKDFLALKRIQYTSHLDVGTIKKILRIAEREITNTQTGIEDKSALFKELIVGNDSELRKILNAS